MSLLLSDVLPDWFAILWPYLIACLREILKTLDKTCQIWTKSGDFVRITFKYGIIYDDKFPKPSESPFITSIDSTMYFYKHHCIQGDFSSLVFCYGSGGCFVE